MEGLGTEGPSLCVSRCRCCSDLVPSLAISWKVPGHFGERLPRPASTRETESTDRHRPAASSPAGGFGPLEPAPCVFGYALDCSPELFVFEVSPFRESAPGFGVFIASSSADSGDRSLFVVATHGPAADGSARESSAPGQLTPRAPAFWSSLCARLTARSLEHSLRRTQPRRRA